MFKKLLKIKIVRFILVLFIFPFYSNEVQAESVGSIAIDEIMYDLPGSDTGREWIEILNSGQDEVDITGWKFSEDNGATKHTLNIPPKNGGQGSMVLSAGGFAIIADNAVTFLIDHAGFSEILIDSSFSLNNTGGTLKLYDRNGVEADNIIYFKTQGANGDGNSLQKVEDGSWQAKVPTPGDQNFIPTPPPPPEPPPLILPEPPPPPEAVMDPVLSDPVPIEVPLIQTISEPAPDPALAEIIIPPTPVEPPVAPALEVAPAEIISIISTELPVSLIPEAPPAIPIPDQNSPLPDPVPVPIEIITKIEETPIIIEPPIQPIPEIVPTEITAPMEPIVAENKIAITEIMYDSPGADVDWVEVQNQGNSDVDLESLKLLINNSSSNHAINNLSGSSVLHPGDYGIIVEKSAIANFINTKSRASMDSMSPQGDFGKSSAESNIFTSSFTLPNTSGKIEINDGDKNSPIDSVTYSAPIIQPIADPAVVENNIVQDVKTENSVVKPAKNIVAVVEDIEIPEIDPIVDKREVQSNVQSSAQNNTASAASIPKIILPDSLSIFLNSKDFSVSIKNNKSEDLDISGFKVDIGGSSFSMPKNTILLANGTITLPPKITNFSKKEEEEVKVIDPEIKTINKPVLDSKIKNLLPVSLNKKITVPKPNLIQKNKVIEVKNNLQASALVGLQGQNKITGIKVKLNSELHSISSFLKGLIGRFHFGFLH